ncbi:hypothetical protein DBT_0964 [Dissulfuribacter thermophilus]|uniref:Uncharacterized protein n=1 Tax=Dissulfuribacter thermophilus TaxID=1156395 RepID=A0A1B9F6V5_9BACT|nr:hypothetical protein DBT_0964 [Dissulfuribacter thermophilus]
MPSQREEKISLAGPRERAARKTQTLNGPKRMEERILDTRIIFP